MARHQKGSRDLGAALWTHARNIALQEWKRLDSQYPYPFYLLSAKWLSLTLLIAYGLSRSITIRKEVRIEQ